MKEGAFLFLTITLCINIDRTKAQLHITGPGTNLTGLLWKIYLKGIGEWVPNLLPDMTFNDKTKDRKPGVNAQVGRRTLKELIADQRQYISDDTQKVDNPGLEKLKDIALRALTALGLSKSAPTRRHHHAQTLVNTQHAKKMSEIAYYLDRNYKSTDYFYHEIKRIKRTGVIVDPLRQMVDWIGKHESGPSVKFAFKCFHDRRLLDRAIVDIWKNKVPNNVYIDPMRDPYAYGLNF